MASSKQHASHSSRRRLSCSKEACTEDQALNSIAKDAEARLAAKRAARAEARSIRMREIERRQKEAADNETSDDSEPPEEHRYSIRTMPRVYANHVSSNASETVLPTTHNSYELQISQLKECIRDGEEKYNKAMVNTAQLDNERQALQYNVEILKDLIGELQEKIENVNDELFHKCSEYNKLGREHNNTKLELKKCLCIVDERERVLFENGINIDGTVKEGYVLPTSSVQCSLCSASLNNDINTVDDLQERASLLAEIESLKCEMEDLKERNTSTHSRREVESMKRNMQQQSVELKTQIQILEQTNAQQEGLIVRLESQVKRYKQQADAAESVEDNLLAEKRKITRELRQCQEQIVELENEKEQLRRRLEKLKSRRGIDV